MSKNKLLLKISPALWSLAIFIIAQALTFATVWRQDPFLEEAGIYVPSQPSDIVSLWPGEVVLPDDTVVDVPAYSALGPIIIYFFVVVVIVGLVLYFLPLHLLQKLMRILFGILFGWSVFVILAIWLPLVPSLVLAVAVGLAWLLYPRVWLHNGVMLLAMVSLAAVFGRFITPWTAVVLLAVLAIYDLLAVRFGFMVWMASKLSLTNAMPAFVFPRKSKGWRSSLQEASFDHTEDEKPGERRFSILGGGDIAFPLLVSASAFFAFGLSSAMLVAVFGLIGLLAAYAIQLVLLKGRPMPALPPIAVTCAVGILLVS
ncbi:MAG: presenilin family intramembrane aspartyl protease [Dehalococcoidia bacterium]|nr:presenilin family intramembrane aspartyl protease [Dehalococcoidia bacterium]